MHQEPRVSQRLPRSCLRCSKSKIKCDKSLPCLQCRSRGLAAHCRAETVCVHGQIYTESRIRHMEPSYDDLVKENQRLRTALSGKPESSHSVADSRYFQLVGRHEDHLYRLLRSEPLHEKIVNVSQVLFPSQDCSMILIIHGSKWTSWLHGAVDQAAFETEVTSFYSSNHIVGIPHYAESARQAWLGMFFAYLTTEWSQARLPHENALQVLYNWYNAALFFLQESQFLRVLDIRNIQTIVILGPSFINFGDFNVYYHLWGCALRMGQALGLPSETAPGLEKVHHMTANIWLWRSIVINDWLQIPLQAGHSGVDRTTAGVGFSEYTILQNSETLEIDPLDFQVVLARLAAILRCFHENLIWIQGDFTALASATLSADNALATLVSQLPAQLKPDEKVSDRTRNRDETHPWLPWQKEKICILLLYYRLVITRLLWDERNNDKPSFENARTICLDTCHGILASINEFDSQDPISHRRLIWSFLLPAFSAAATLKSYSGPCQCGTTTNHSNEINACIEWFRQAEKRSVYAATALRVLQE